MIPREYPEVTGSMPVPANSIRAPKLSWRLLFSCHGKTSGSSVGNDTGVNCCHYFFYQLLSVSTTFMYPSGPFPFAVCDLVFASLSLQAYSWEKKYFCEIMGVSCS